MTKLQTSRVAVDVAIGIAAAVALMGLVLDLRTGSRNGASFQGVCLVFQALVWFGALHARALLDAKIRKWTADAAIAELAHATMRRAVESGQDLGLSIPVGQAH